MKTKYYVEILSVNDDGKIHRYDRTEKDLICATRIILTFKPKRGYEIKQWTVDKIETFV